jgi:hypothetical protein
MSHWIGGLSRRPRKPDLAPPQIQPAGTGLSGGMLSVLREHVVSSTSNHAHGVPRAWHPDLIRGPPCICPRFTRSIATQVCQTHPFSCTFWRSLGEILVVAIFAKTTRATPKPIIDACKRRLRDHDAQ